MDAQKTQSTVTTHTPTPPKLIKPRGTLKLKFIILLLLLLLIGLIAGGAFAGYKGYSRYKEKRDETTNLNKEVESLKAQQNLSVVDLQKQINDLKSRNDTLTNENKRLSDNLTIANNRIAQLTPKDVKDLRYMDLIKINQGAGDVWLNPIYTDLTGDSKADGVYAYRTGGTGGFLNVYVYTYGDNNTLSQVLKAEGYQQGTVSVSEGNIVQIQSTVGAPDNQQIVITRFKWDNGAKKMVKI